MWLLQVASLQQAQCTAMDSEINKSRVSCTNRLNFIKVDLFPLTTSMFNATFQSTLRKNKTRISEITKN